MRRDHDRHGSAVRRAHCATAICRLALQACSDSKSTEPVKPPVPSMAAVSELIQQGVVDHVAASAPTVRVTDAAGTPLSGARVVFSGSAVFPAVITGADGLATINWKLTQNAGPQTITARLYSVDGEAPLGPEVTFIANAIADAVAGVRAATDLALVGFPLHAVAATPTVAVVDQFSNGEANVEVRFETTGGSTVSPASATTDSRGLAYITEWTLGPNLGIDTLIARVGDLAPVYFTARASPPFHASAVVVANQTTCAISDGDVYCWGSNARGKVSVNAPSDAFTSPQRIPLPAKATSISGGYNHECAITTEVPPQAYCWGDNSFGQLGVDVSKQLYGGPFRVPVADGLASVAAGMDHTCGLTPAGVAYCWGNGPFGQLGTGAIAGCFVPAPGKLTCSGPAPVVGDARFVEVAAGASHTCGVASSGQLYCWGLNDSGQLGSPSLSPCVIENSELLLRLLRDLHPLRARSSGRWQRDGSHGGRGGGWYVRARRIGRRLLLRAPGGIGVRFDHRSIHEFVAGRQLRGGAWWRRVLLDAFLRRADGKLRSTRFSQPRAESRVDHRRCGAPLRHSPERRLARLLGQQRRRPARERFESEHHDSVASHRTAASVTMRARVQCHAATSGYCDRCLSRFASSQADSFRCSPAKRTGARRMRSTAADVSSRYCVGAASVCT